MTALQMRIIKRAIKARLADGESFDEIIASYTKLTVEEKEQLKAEFDIESEG